MMPSVSSSGIAAPLGEAQRPLRPSRAGLYAALTAAAVLIIGGSGFWYWWSMNRPGSLQLTVAPADATVSIDNVKVGDHSPITIEKPPGTYMVSVTRDGYLRNDQNVELRAGQQARFAITLEASPDTGFELTSEPPGGLVWLDGVPIKGADRRAGAHRLPRLPHPARPPRARDQGREPLQALAAGHRSRAGRDPEGARDAGADGSRWSSAVAAGAASRDARRGARRAAAEPAAGAEARGHAHAVVADRPSRSRASTGVVEPAHRAAARWTRRGGATRRSRATRSRRRDGADSSDDGSESAGAAAEGGDCSITIGSRPWSEVWIDGKNTDQAHAVRRLQGRLRQAQAQLQAARSADRPAPRPSACAPGEKFKQSFTLETEQPE